MGQGGFFSTGAMDFYDKSEKFKQRALQDMRRTNFGAVSGDVIERIGTLLYDARVMRDEHAQLRSYTEIVDIEPTPDGATVALRDWATEHVAREHWDCVVFATGYDNSGLEKLLEPLKPYLLHDAGRLRIDGDHRIVSRPSMSAGIYLQGYAPYAHGVTEGTITSIARRAARIAGSIARARPIIAAMPEDKASSPRSSGEPNAGTPRQKRPAVSRADIQTVHAQR